MAGNDKTFFVELGKRVAQARKDHGMTQQQLAEALGIAQQTLAHYEGARLRVPASMLPQLASILGMPVETLIGQAAKRAARRGSAPELQQHMERISQLPKLKQKFVMQMLETVLAQQGR
jgi:transcriptional regulator with XRE-family HTH domain